jgi:hypothetical protein
VLALCSYVVGMEMPGLRSLFTKASVQFHAAPSDVPELLFQVRSVRFEPHFRLLDLELVVATPTGELIATARLRTYVPFSPVVTDVSQLAARLDGGANLEGKVALVCGASRGLGLDLATTLAAAGCHVYAASRGGTVPAADMTLLKGRVEGVRGDVGNAEWCAELLETIRATHGRLDLLVLNAARRRARCASGLRRSSGKICTSARTSVSFRRHLAVFLSTLNDHRGCVVYISSSFVDQPPSGFSHYVALKQAGEGLVRAAG